jgi:hypothetical protein
MPEAESRLPGPTAQRLHGDECNLLPRHMIATEWVKGKARVRRGRDVLYERERTHATPAQFFVDTHRADGV